MTENSKKMFQGLGNPETQVKAHISHKYLKSKTKTALRIQNEYGQDAHCVPLDQALRLLDEKTKYETLDFYKRHAGYLLCAEKKRKALEDKLTEDVKIGSHRTQELSQPVTLFVKWMETSGQPILCVETSIVEEALDLVRLKVQSSLSRQHILDLPDPNVTHALEQQFEEMCAKLKIPRRTRAIIERKKLAPEPSLIVSNLSDENENNIHDLETK